VDEGKFEGFRRREFLMKVDEISHLKSGKSIHILERRR
jgi:hypothetical protein